MDSFFLWNIQLLLDLLSHSKDGIFMPRKFLLLQDERAKKLFRSRRWSIQYERCELLRQSGIAKSSHYSIPMSFEIKSMLMGFIAGKTFFFFLCLAKVLFSKP